MKFKLNIISVPIIFFAVISAGCGKLSTVRQPVSNIVISPIEGQANCLCDPAILDKPGTPKEQMTKIYQVSNTGGLAGELVGTRYERLNTSSENTVKRTDVSMPLPPHSKPQLLECPVQPDTRKVCNKLVSYEFNGINYPHAIAEASRELVIKTVIANTELMSTYKTPPSNACVSACSEGGDCTELPDTSHSTDGQLGRDIVLLLGNLNKDSTIGNKTIMELTKSGQNECSRTDIVFVDNVGYNYGDACGIQGKLPSGDTVDIMIPANFQMNYNKKGATGNFELQFFKSQAAPKIIFSDLEKQKTIGGSIKQINFIDNKAFIQNEKLQCFAVKVR